MERGQSENDDDPEFLAQTGSRWRRWLKQALREVRLRELSSLWGQLGVWLRHVKQYRPLLGT